MAAPAMIIASNKGPVLHLQASRGGGREYYTGIISKIGIDLGVTHQGSLQWAVLALSQQL